MNKTQVILVLIIAILVGIIVVLLTINQQKEEKVVTKVVMVDNILQKLIDEPGIDEWRLSSYENDTTLYLTVEFDSVESARVKISRNFSTPGELSENIDTALEEARLLK